MTSSLYNDLFRTGKLLKCPVTGNEYIPLDVVRTTVTVERVKEMLSFTWLLQWVPCWNSVLESKIPQARRVIAILVRVGKKDTIGSLLKDELTDQDLPLSREEGQHSDVLKSQCGSKKFVSFAAWDEATRDLFLEKQWEVIIPALALTAVPTARNIQLHDKCPLPFSLCGEVSATSYSIVYEAELKLPDGVGFLLLLCINT